MRPIFARGFDIRTFWPYLLVMSSTAVTAAAHESEDMDRAIAQIVQPTARRWYIVVEGGRVVDYATDVRTACKLAAFHRGVAKCA